MKNLIAILISTAISWTSFAATTCDKAAIELAKMNLDSKARAYGFPESYIVEASLKFIGKTKDGSQTYTVGGDIYKGEYELSLVMDSLCGVESVTIKDVSPR